MAMISSVGEYLGSIFASEYEVAELVERGIPLETVTRLRESGFTYAEVGEIVIAPRTLKHRKARGEALSTSEADRLLRVVRVLDQASQVFGSKEKGFRWLRTPDDRLRSRAPLTLLGTESGGRLIESMLWQIDEGIYA